MISERFKFLVKEYRLAQKRLSDLTADHMWAEASVELSGKLKRELETEVSKAKDSKDSAMVKYWQDILKECFDKDKDFLSEKDVEKEKKKLTEKKEKLIMYYKKKIKIIGKSLGSRFTELLDSYDQKNILLGGEHSSTRLVEEIEKDEDQRFEEEQKKKGFTFDKM